ncbi:MAG TPA: hypothetical protein VE615_07785 [Gaiellaceae bacterium]|jgi:hypothetical protein|nr:hypothetical protein [Gaiellaceae bacterium]
MNAASPQPTRGLGLILEHCARLNASDHVRPSAALRLEQLVGGDLARLLVSALSGDHAGRPRLV